MTTQERETAERVLRAYMDGLDAFALERVIRGERWCTHYCWRSADGARCLVGHAQDASHSHDPMMAWSVGSPSPDRQLCEGAALAFDDLCGEQGIARTVAACQSYAATLIATRTEATLTRLAAAVGERGEVTA